MNLPSLSGNPPAKRYYSIGEVAEMFQVSKSLIRFWETEFDFLKPHKNSKGDRRFTQQNIEQIRTIYFLVKEKGFTLQGAKMELAQQKEQTRRKQEVLDRLNRIREGLLSLRDSL